MIPVASDHPPGVVCIATGELTRYAMFHQDLAMLRVPAGTCFAWTMGPLIALNMNTNFEKVFLPRLDEHGVEQAPYQWAWILGDDHTFDPMTLMRLLDRRREVIAPLCLTREPPCGFTIIDEANGRLRDFDKVPTAGVFELEEYEVCGDAGMLLTRDALARIGPPWYESLISGSKVSEDRHFARKIHDAGLPIHVDANVTLGHITPCLIEPVATDDGRWLVRFSVGRTPLVQFLPVPAPEPETARA